MQTDKAHQRTTTMTRLKAGFLKTDRMAFDESEHCACGSAVRWRPHDGWSVARWTGLMALCGGTFLLGPARGAEVPSRAEPPAAGAQPPRAPSGPGSGLSPEQAQALEDKIKTNPEDTAARTQLLDHYSRLQFRSAEARQARQGHILWMIDHHPESDVRGPSMSLDPRFDGAAYEEGKKLWLKQVQVHPENLSILDHAANYLLLVDRDAAEELWKKAESSEPANPRWPEKLAHLYNLSAITRDGVDVTAARKALIAMEKARATAKEGEFNYLDSLAKMAFDAGETEKARTYANKLLEQATEHTGQWNYGNAIHDGNVILGRIALREGKVVEAKEYLLSAGKTPGSPQLNSFGPTMTLARELADKGEKETVLAYFKLCRAFWKMGGERLDAWTDALASGRTPDFGANSRR